MCFVLCTDTVVQTQVRHDAGPQDHYGNVGALKEQTLVASEF